MDTRQYTTFYCNSVVLDPSGINSWDPVTKTIKIKYWMEEAGVAGHKTSFDETWTYIGPR